MDLDWTTFALEIINFLILVWVLTRLLYKPVLNAIARRKADIMKTLSDAEMLRREAQTLRDQFEQREADWIREKETARSRMVEEVNAEKTRLLAGLQASLKQEREKSNALQERRLTDLTRHAEERAVSQSASFASKLLARLASPELEARLVEVVTEDLHRLPDDRQQAIRTACARADLRVIVSSAYALSQPQKESLTEAVQSLTGRSVSCEWREDSRLLAGVRLSVGPWMLGANLQDELKFFSEPLCTVSPSHAS